MVQGCLQVLPISFLLQRVPTLVILDKLNNPITTWSWSFLGYSLIQNIHSYLSCWLRSRNLKKPTHKFSNDRSRRRINFQRFSETRNISPERTNPGLTPRRSSQ